MRNEGFVFDSTHQAARRRIGSVDGAASPAVGSLGSLLGEEIVRLARAAVELHLDAVEGDAPRPSETQLASPVESDDEAAWLRWMVDEEREGVE